MRDLDMEWSKGGDQKDLLLVECMEIWHDNKESPTKEMINYLEELKYGKVVKKA